MRIALAVLLSLSATTSQADDYKCKEADPTTKITATFSASTSLHDLSVWILSFTCKNVVFAPDVAKHATKVTVMAPKPMTPKQALQLFVDAVEATGLVVQQKSDTVIIKLGPTMPKNCPDLAIAPRQPKTYDAIPTTAPTPEPTDADMAKALAAIKKLDANQYDIPKDLVDAVLANPMAMLKGGRVVPAMTNGKPDGLKLYAIRPSSIFAKLGLANGDTLKSINKLTVNTAEEALDLYAKLRSATKLEVALVRRGARDPDLDHQVTAISVMAGPGSHLVTSRERA